MPDTATEEAQKKIDEQFTKFHTLDGKEYKDCEFREKELKNHLDEVSVKLQTKRIEDVEQRLIERPRMIRHLLELLVWQNIIVFLLVIVSQYIAINSIFLSIIVPATLGETAFMVHKIVDFAFRDIDYHPHKDE